MRSWNSMEIRRQAVLANLSYCNICFKLDVWHKAFGNVWDWFPGNGKLNKLNEEAGVLEIRRQADVWHKAFGNVWDWFPGNGKLNKLNEEAGVLEIRRQAGTWLQLNLLQMMAFGEQRVLLLNETGRVEEQTSTD
ncbi:hypothetical protein Tco_1362004 [Tanacetum coccineum]